MKQYNTQDQRGISRVGLVIVIAVLLIAGLLIWQRVRTNNNKDNQAATATQQAARDARCDYTDTDLCKFFAVRRAVKDYSLRSTSETNGQRSNIHVRYDGNDKFHMKVTGANPTETISIDNTLYTKGTDNTWVKQTVSNAEARKTTESIDPQLPEAVKDADATKVSYKASGTEKCGEQTCLKYQVINPATASTTTYIWFDNQDYQLRRLQSTATGGRFDTTYSYEAITIAAPTPTRDAAPATATNSNVQGDATTLPKTGDD